MTKQEQILLQESQSAMTDWAHWIEINAVEEPSPFEVRLNEMNTARRYLRGLGLITKSRESDAMFARQIIMHFFCYKTKFNLYQIGRIMVKYHATVIHARRKIDDLTDVNDIKCLEMKVRIQPILEELEKIVSSQIVPMYKKRKIRAKRES